MILYNFHKNDTVWIIIENAFGSSINTPTSFGGSYASLKGTTRSIAPFFSNQFRHTSFNLGKCLIWLIQVNLFKPLSLHSNPICWITTMFTFGDVSGESITTATRHISSTSGNIQTHNLLVSSKVGSFLSLACTGACGKPIPPSASGIYMGYGLESFSWHWHMLSSIARSGFCHSFCWLYSLSALWLSSITSNGGVEIVCCGKVTYL